MSSGAHLQLFPPPPGAAKTSKPKRKPSRRRADLAPSPSMDAEHEVSPISAVSPKLAGLTEEIVIHISPSTKKMVNPKAAPSRSATPSSNKAPSRAGTPSSAIRSPKRWQAASPSSLTSPMSDEMNKRLSNLTADEIKPIRSMFPKYNPDLPLTQQQYRPSQTSPTHIPRAFLSKGAASPAPADTTPRDLKKGFASGPVTSPELPSSQTPQPPKYATPQELEALWDVSNGQEIRQRGRDFPLRLKREGTVDSATGKFEPTVSECFTFQSSTGKPFYDLQTLKEQPTDVVHSECVLRRHDPTKNAAVPIMFLKLEPPVRQLPPHDGLIAEIFPKVAAMMAIDEAKAFSGRDAEEHMRLATERECCRLLWNEEKAKYHLYHPGLNGGQTFIIHKEGNAGFDLPGARGKFRLIDVHTGDTLVTLDFATQSLIVNTAATSKIPSLYIVDVTVTAVLLTAIVEGRKVRSNQFEAPPTAPLKDVESGKRMDKKSMKKAEKKALKLEKEAEKENLPTPTRGVLSALFGTYRLVVWGLGLLVKALAAFVVALSSAVTGKHE